MLKKFKWGGTGMWDGIGLTMPPDASSPSKPGSNKIQSPYKDLKREIIIIISQKPSTSIQNCTLKFQSKKKKNAR